MNGRPPDKGTTPEDWAALGSGVARLSDSKLLQIYGLLEQVGDKPELNGAFAAMRPRLVSLRPPRRPRLSRLFFRPAEDLLDDADHYNRKLGRVSRATLMPVWRALGERLPGDLVQQVQRGLARTDRGDMAALAARMEPLWQAGATALDALLTDCANDLRLKVALFGRDDDVQRQIATLRDVLSVAMAVEGLKLRLPSPPVGELTEAQLDILRQALDAAAAQGRDPLAALLTVQASRMQRPGDLLRLMGEVKLANVQEREALSREMSGYVVGNLLRQSAAFEQVVPAATDDPDGLALAAERLTEGLNSVNDVVVGLRDKDVSQKMGAARGEIGQFIVRQVCAGIDESLLTNLFPASDGPADAAALKQAERLALALRRSAKIAPHLGVQKEIGERIAQVRRQVEQRTRQLLQAAPRGRDGSMGEAAQRQMFNSLRIMEIVAGSDEAERLFREWRRQIS